MVNRARLTTGGGTVYTSKYKPKYKKFTFMEDCPRCGSFLIIMRNRHLERYITCTKYPKCHFTAPVREL